MKNSVKIIEASNHFETSGLCGLNGRELKVQKKSRNSSEYIRVLRYLSSYVEESKRPKSIESGHTIAFHSWLLQFQYVSDGFVDIWEVDSKGDGFLVGVDLSLSIIRQQERACEERGQIPVFPNFAQQIVISKGVYEGHAVDGVRYPSPKHMTGWWLVTDLYNDDIESLMTVHYYHVAFKRPDLLRYLALPYGFRFSFGAGLEEIWYDSKVLADEL